MTSCFLLNVKQIQIANIYIYICIWMLFKRSLTIANWPRSDVWKIILSSTHSFWLGVSIPSDYHICHPPFSDYCRLCKVPTVSCQPPLLCCMCHVWGWWKWDRYAGVFKLRRQFLSDKAICVPCTKYCPLMSEFTWIHRRKLA